MEEKTTKKGKEKNQKNGRSLKKHWENLVAEYHRITWPSRDSLTKSTAAVLASSVALGVIIAVVDMIIKFGLGLIIA